MSANKTKYTYEVYNLKTKDKINFKFYFICMVTEGLGNLKVASKI